jgi:protein phosphatase
VLGKRIVTTRASRKFTIEENNAMAALEVMARHAINPKWLIYLPPTMSPSETSRRDGLLEHPDEAFTYFKAEGVQRVIVEEKHMGSRALLVVCRDADVARERFGVVTGETGAIYSRTGRSFFDAEMTEAVLARIRSAMDAADFWDRQQTGWALLDAEIMPWSAKAQSLIREQYAATGAAAKTGLSCAVAALKQAAKRQNDVGDLLAHMETRRSAANKYTDAYGRYCWPVTTLDDYRIAPFHILATEGGVHMDRDHLWHMSELAKLAKTGDKLIMATAHHLVDLEDEASTGSACDWWAQLTAEGGEGMVVKPLQFVSQGRRGIVQPAIKCRGAEYLRIIYGPEYDLARNLTRLRSRGLGKKRSLAIREFLLGREALDRFATREPLRRVHEAVFAVLALESEPVDPRL